MRCYRFLRVPTCLDSPCFKPVNLARKSLKLEFPLFICTCRGRNKLNGKTILFGASRTEQHDFYIGGRLTIFPDNLSLDRTNFEFFWQEEPEPLDLPT